MSRAEVLPPTASAQPAEALPPGGFFTHHGWLAPAVRLFRTIGFPAKAAWVSAAFLAPLAIMLGFLWNSANDQIEFARAERRGLTYVRPLIELMEAAQARRQAAASGEGTLPGLQARVQAAFDAVQARERELGGEFATAQPFADFHKHHEALLREPKAGTTEATFAAHSAYIDSALDLVRAVADGSQLALDPDLDTYHMMNVAVLRGPLQIENTARIVDVGSRSLNDEARRLLERWDAVWDYVDRDVQSSYHAGVAGIADAEAQFDMKGTDAVSEGLRTELRQLVASGAAGASGTAFAEAGRKALGKQLALVKAISARLDAGLQARIERLQFTRNVQLATAALFVSLAAYLMLAFYRVMRGGLEEVARHLREIANGNLTTTPKPWGRDEAAMLMLTLAQMQVSLKRLVGGVLQGAGGVQTASEEIAAASGDMAHRTAQSTSTLQQTASSMAQISAVAGQALTTIDSAVHSVQANAHDAERGGQAIADVVQTMDGIRDSSTRIGEIIGVIDGIAFQTNILALNAAVEAARAGEHGRGFAVVASEVRALAARSAAAARQIKTLISTSIAQVESGATVVARAGEIIRAVVDNADRVAHLMGDVAQGATVQTRSVGEVGTAMQQLDAAMQQDAALVEQTAAAAAALSEQARQLCAEVGSFRLA